MSGVEQGSPDGSSDGSFEDLGRILVIVPTFNEIANIERILGRIRAAVPEAHVLVVDDNSPDGTGKKADEFADSDEHVHVLHRTGKQGLGAAYLHGFRWALDAGYDVIVEMDADGSHQPEQLPRLLARLSTADLVLGSRWIPGGSVVNWPLVRKLISRGGTTYARLALGVDLHDITGGYRAFRRTTLEGIGLDDVESQGYCFQIDLAYRAVSRGFRVAEVPIEFVEREVGTSKMSNKIVGEALWKVTQWGFQKRVLTPLRRL